MVAISFRPNLLSARLTLVVFTSQVTKQNGTPQTGTHMPRPAQKQCGLGKLAPQCLQFDALSPVQDPNLADKVMILFLVKH